MTRLVQGLEAEGLVIREIDARDRRVARVRASEKGRRTLMEGRERRVRALAAQLTELSAGDLESLDVAVRIIERLLSGLRRS
jgi:DNA-binding MarR family transcriptional regulator